MTKVITFDERLALITKQLSVQGLGAQQRKVLETELRRIERLINWARSSACMCK